jgi:hypothetical protein
MKSVQAEIDKINKQMERDSQIHQRRMKKLDATLDCVIDNFPAIIITSGIVGFVVLILSKVKI